MQQQPVIVIDSEGRIADLNESARQLLGAARGRRCRDVIGARKGTGLPVCSEDCAVHLVGAALQRDEREAWIRGVPSRLLCSGLGCSGVVTVLPGSHTTPVLEALTPREREVLALVADGLTSRLIALRLGVRVSTVRTHVERCRSKMGAASRAEAVARAMEQGQLHGAI